MQQQLQMSLGGTNWGKPRDKNEEENRSWKEEMKVHYLIKLTADPWNAQSDSHEVNTRNSSDLAQQETADTFLLHTTTFHQQPFEKKPWHTHTQRFMTEWANFEEETEY